MSKTRKVIRFSLWGFSALCFLAVGYFAFLQFQFVQARQRVNEIWASTSYSKLPDFGSTETLRILPLVDWHTKSPELLREPGVSYLIETDEHRILFDVGLNAKQSSPSPLENNMKRLGVNLAAIDTIFITHNHGDHVGGRKWAEQKTFSLGNEQVDLSGKKVFTPISMHYPNLQTSYVAEPMSIGKGIASLGPIAARLFIGEVEEQVLAIRLRDRGIVLVVGCAHPGLEKIIHRAEEIFEDPIYGIVGGLHYPVPHGRIQLYGFLDAQRRLVSGDGPLSPISMEEVHKDLIRLKVRDLKLIALGGHDSSDEVIQLFADTFLSSYHYLRVGDPIEVGAENKQVVESDYRKTSELLNR